MEASDSMDDLEEVDEDESKDEHSHSSSSDMDGSDASAVQYESQWSEADELMK